MAVLRALSNQEIEALKHTGNRADDWSKLTITDEVDVSRIRNVTFRGEVSITALGGDAALHHSVIEWCSLGRNVTVRNVGVRLANYNVGDNACIENVGLCETGPGATFGNGVEVETVNEGGGRIVRLFDGLTSQIAYMMALYRHRPTLMARLDKLVDDRIAKVKSNRGHIGEGACVDSVSEIIDVNIGPYTRIIGVSRLRNGTILSEKGAPAYLGSDVVADDFIITEGSKVDSGAILDKCFVGQAVKLGKTFSAENCLFFCNSEGFHSEAVAVFGGPFTVTHHRSTLLIAAQYSFYNAGSATNSSNHMYKLGPVHQGILERGSKTASSSYTLWPCVIGPFTVVMGKNMANFDTSDFPFSYISSESEGSMLTPGMNMFTVGTTRDGEKWPNRDRRKASSKRDLINFDVFSPFTVGRMLRGEAILRDLAAKTDRATKIVRHKGIVIKRLLLKTGAKNFAGGIDRYLFGEILKRAENGLLAGDPSARSSRDWCDISGLLINRDRLMQILERIESGELSKMRQVKDAFIHAWERYDADAWAWVRSVYEERHGKSVDALTEADIETIRAAFNKMEASFTRKLLADAEKEFDEEASLGFGRDGGDGAIPADFEAVRGTFEGNSFVKGLKKRLEDLGAV